LLSLDSLNELFDTRLQYADSIFIPSLRKKDLGDEIKDPKVLLGSNDSHSA